MGLVEREAEMQELNAPRPGRSRDLFGVQLEVRYMWEIYSFNRNACKGSYITIKERTIEGTVMTLKADSRLIIEWSNEYDTCISL
ncbi:hypothetical protein DBV15_03387 [Temnothorax longispinosus]|uniref:Uncharacterized protein n=1 Tax=Temnothorax longispinosus TaxID=300112 RepID=A0A4S2KHG5_9HYME|nr:hypothetical protein DBV15_03387 [Temnothorax longispinosus]